MILLHLGTSEKQLFLWGEAPLNGHDTSESYLPYAATAKKLVTAAEAADLYFQEEEATSLHVWLPTRDSTPLPSSPLVANIPPDENQPILSPWRIPAIPLSIEDTIHFLGTCYDDEMIAPGILTTPDIRFFVKLLRFSGALVALEQFIPSLSERDSVFQAVWEPVIAGKDEEKLATLASAMPHVCRALTRESTAVPKEASIAIASWIIESFVDYLVRLSWTNKPPSRMRKAGKKSFASMHDQWIHALRTWSPIMPGNVKDLKYLSGQIRAWHRSLSVSAKTPFRLSFRLEEPETGDPHEQWYVRYLLNATDDPSLFIEVADAWTPNKQTKSIFAKYHINIQEYLLTSLGYVSGLHPVLEESLKRSRPGGANLDTTDAYTFLTEIAWLLQQSGYGVQLPAWWTSTGARRLSVHASASPPPMRSKGEFSLESVVDFNWEIALDDENLSLEEIETLTRLKIPLVKIRGQWMQFDAGAIQEAINFWKKIGSEETSARDVIHMALGTAHTPEKLPLKDVEATGWIGDLLYTLEHGANIEEIPTPEEFEGTLRPYQSRGFSWLAFLQQWGFGACLADDMGLGKTPQTLALIQRSWDMNKRHPVLVVCPTSVIGNWQKEAAYFTPNLPVLVHHGTRRTKKPEIFRKQVLKQAIVITGFPLLHRDFELLNQIKWRAIILDEAQNIKNPRTKQAKAARAFDCDYRIALTGTPVENNVGELWSIMEFINPGFLHTQAEFKRRFFVPIQMERNPEAIRQLKQITGPFILRRLKTDKSIINDLPEKQETNVFTKLTKEQGSLYRAVVKETSEALESAENIQRRGLILSILMKLKQICNHPAQFLHDASAIPGRSGKLIRLTEMLEEVYEVEDRVLIFTQFTEMGNMIQQYLQETFGREVLFLHGGVPKEERDRMVERFQVEENGPLFFLLSLKAAGTGLNLTRANHVFHYDRWWNPSVENQATDRAFRIGQTKHVQVYKFVCTGTIEEHINEMIETKKEIAESVVTTGEEWITEMSTRDLKKILQLQEGAVDS